MIPKIPLSKLRAPQSLFIEKSGQIAAIMRGRVGIEGRTLIILKGYILSAKKYNRVFIKGYFVFPFRILGSFFRFPFLPSSRLLPPGIQAIPYTGRRSPI